MTSQNKLFRYISRLKNRDFKKQVQEEKKQKYLFREDQEEHFFSKRNSFAVWKKHKLMPYSNFFGKGIELFDRYVFESKILSILGGILLWLSGYIIFFSPYFQVSPSNVIIESITPWVDLNIAYRSIEDIYSESLLFLDEEATALKIKQSLKNIAHIRIDKLYPNGLKILLTGSPIPYRVTIYGISNRTWWLSENGVLIPIGNWGLQYATGTNLQDMEIVSDPLRNEELLDYKQVIDDTTMYQIRSTLTLFQEQFQDLTVQKIRYLSVENELHLLLNSKTLIILSIHYNPEKSDQENKDDERIRFVSLLRYFEEAKWEILNGSITYIDGRIARKLFVCREKIICRDNLISVYGSVYSQE